MAEQDGKQGSESQAPAVPQDAGPSSQSFERFNLIGRLVWALILVWVGGVLLADNLGYLERVALPPVSLPWSMPLRPAVWRLVILGVGALLALGVIARLLLSRYREDVVGNLILVIVCVSLGFGYVELIWPLILIALGIALLVKRGFF
jgi:uncharacterized membrane protein